MPTYMHLFRKPVSTDESSLEYPTPTEVPTKYSLLVSFNNHNRIRFSVGKTFTNGSYPHSATNKNISVGTAFVNKNQLSPNENSLLGQNTFLKV